LPTSTDEAQGEPRRFTPRNDIHYYHLLD